MNGYSQNSPQGEFHFLPRTFTLYFAKVSWTSDLKWGLSYFSVLKQNATGGVGVARVKIVPETGRRVGANENEIGRFIALVC